MAAVSRASRANAGSDGPSPSVGPSPDDVGASVGAHDGRDAGALVRRVRRGDEPGRPSRGEREHAPRLGDAAHPQHRAAGLALDHRALDGLDASEGEAAPHGVALRAEHIVRREGEPQERDATVGRADDEVLRPDASAPPSTAASFEAGDRDPGDDVPGSSGRKTTTSGASPTASREDAVLVEREAEHLAFDGDLPDRRCGGHRRAPEEREHRRDEEHEDPHHGDDHQRAAQADDASGDRVRDLHAPRGRAGPEDRLRHPGNRGLARRGGHGVRRHGREPRREEGGAGGGTDGTNDGRGKGARRDVGDPRRSTDGRTARAGRPDRRPALQGTRSRDQLSLARSAFTISGVREM